jgi:hypothetical protein
MHLVYDLTAKIAPKCAGIRLTANEKPRFFGVARSERKNQSLNAIYSITARSERFHGPKQIPPPNAELPRRRPQKFPIYFVLSITFVCSNC